MSKRPFREFPPYGEALRYRQRRGTYTSIDGFLENPLPRDFVLPPCPPLPPRTPPTTPRRPVRPRPKPNG